MSASLEIKQQEMTVMIGTLTKANLAKRSWERLALADEAAAEAAFAADAAKRPVRKELGKQWITMENLDDLVSSEEKSILERMPPIRDLKSLSDAWPWGKSFCAIDRDGITYQELIILFVSEAKKLASEFPPTEAELDLTYSPEDRTRTLGPFSGRSDWGERMVHNLISHALRYQYRKANCREHDLVNLNNVNGSLYEGLSEITSETGRISPAFGFFKKTGSMDLEARVANSLLFARCAWMAVLEMTPRDDKLLSSFGKQLRYILITPALQRADARLINYPNMLRELPCNPAERFM